MNAFGLTGNIGCGKSTVINLLSKNSDVMILDCDHIAKEIISDGNNRNKIIDILGYEVFTEEQPNFGLMARIIFGDGVKREYLEQLIHPLVWEWIQNEVETKGKEKICIVESAILFETKIERQFRGVIVATCNTDEQFRRLKTNRQMTTSEINARLSLQISSEEKVARAQFVIHTDCDLIELEHRVSKLYENLKRS